MRIGKRRVLAMAMISLSIAGCAPEVPPTIETIQSTAQALDTSSAWTSTTRMLSKRQEHAALMLKDKRILVIGGTADPSETAEYFTPTSKTWTRVVAPDALSISTKSGCRPAMAQLENGTETGGLVLVVSTDWTAGISSASTFDLSTSTWKLIFTFPTVTCTPSVFSIASDMALILVDDDAAAEIVPYLYNGGSISGTTALPAPKEGTWIGSAAIRLNDGRVLISGGAGVNAPVRNKDSILFDASNPNPWITAGDMFIRRAQHAVALLPNGNVLAVGGRCLGPHDGIWADTAEIFDVQSMTWGPTAPMANTRIQGHTATLLNSGLVLAIGGSTSSTAELFDPSVDQWTPLESADDVRFYNHASTLIEDGSVLVTGGTVSGESDDAALCNALVFAWEQLASFPAESRGYHSTTALDDGTLLVGGGASSNQNGALQSLQDAWLYDAQTNAWTAANFSSFPRALHTATKLPNGRVLFAGGMDESAIVSELFNPNALMNPWSNAASLPVPIMGAAATLVEVDEDGNRQVLQVGGIYSGGTNEAAHDVLLYDPDSDLWNSAPDMPEDPQRFGHSVTLLGDDTVLVAGGFTSCPTTDKNATAIATAARYNPATKTWSSVASMTQARAFHSATLLRDGRVLVTGGGGEIADNCIRPTWQSVHSSSEIFKPDSNTWTPAGIMNEARTEHQAVRLEGGSVLIAGGRRTSNRILVTAEVFDPDTKSWIGTSRLQTGRYGHSLTLLDSGVVAIGGFHTFASGNESVERYPQAAQGAPCTVDDQCKSKVCSGGVCCNATCDNQCVACSKAINANKTLDDGICEDVSGCAPYACETETGLCGTVCTEVNECASGYVCDPAGACVDPVPNASMVDDSGCTAGRITDSNTSSSWASFALLAGIYALRRRKHQRKS